MLVRCNKLTNMSVDKSIFVLRTLLLMWIFCAVMCEHHKRDVKRIIIKERMPRRHKDSHGHSHHHEHSHNRGSRGHKYKKANKHHSSSEDVSLEDNDSSGVSSSAENSFENIFPKHKSHKFYHHQHSKKSYNRHSPTINQGYDQNKQEPYGDESSVIFRNEWHPTSVEHHNSHKSPNKDKHNKRSGNKSKTNYMTSLNPPPIEITTSYPFQFGTSTLFPQLNSFPDAFLNYNLNNKIMEANQSPLIGTIEQPKFQFSEVKNYDSSKNYRNNYEVTELNTAASNINTFISVPDESDLSNNSNEEMESETKRNEVVTTTQKPSRIRGRVTYRGIRKFT